jgi:hypothetical protein
MTEVVLNYDSNIVPQETGYWCGPASAQVCLNIRGVFVDEYTLAQECGTDEGGTDWVGMIEGSLDSRLPEANYTSVMSNSDPPSQQDKDRFWDGLKRSIDNGYGVICNWVSPPGNHPVGIKGSASPDYGGGTIYHYVTAAGYDDEGAKAVWIADSGFWPWGYWVSFDQCASLIPPKALCYANLEPEMTMPDYDKLAYEQLCGPVDPDTGYGTGWPQNGQNEAGQNLYLVDLLAQVLTLVDPDAPGDSDAVAQAYDAPHYDKLNFDQLAGPEGTGWPQLGGRSVNDAIVHIKETLTAGEPPLGHPVSATVRLQGVGSLGAGVQVVAQPSSPSPEPGQRQEQDSPPT